MPSKSNSSTPTSPPNKAKSSRPAKPAQTPPPARFSVPRRWIWVAAISGGVVVLGIGGLAFAAYVTQKDTIVRGTSIAGQDVSGLDTLAAMERVEQRWKSFSTKGFVFQAGTTEIIIPTSGGSSENELVLDIATFDVIDAANRAYDYGHSGSFWKQARQRLSGFIGRKHDVAKPKLNSPTLLGELKAKLASMEQPAANAGLAVESDGRLRVTESSSGRTFEYAAAVKAAGRRLAKLDTAPVEVTTVTVQPEIASSAALQTIADQEAAALIAPAPITMTYQDKRWELSEAELKKSLGFITLSRRTHVGVVADKLEAQLADAKNEVEVAPQEAKFTIENGKVKEFQTSVVGKSLDLPKTAKALDQALRSSTPTVALTVQEQLPVSNTVAPNQLGIKELVATGKTNFRGSPVNRRYNLSLGAQRLHGLMIKPGETFSLIGALGKIDGAHGWKPELVIKQGGRITPEFGGGLCQVATTLFRAALNAGLPIVERVNHSLRISYYEPPIGLDATIYEPKPDLRFKNDYAGHLLLQTRVVGDELIFEFYGIKDGRTVDLPTPKVYAQTPIPATKTIEVTDLKPGQKVCQAPGHPGARATATYTVTKPNGEKVTQVFESHYRAIGVICRVGKAKKSEPKPKAQED